MNNQGQQPVTVEQAETTVEIYDALKRLEKTNDFKKVFTEHLFTNEIIRLHSLMAHPEQSIVDSRDKIISDLDALSNVKFALQMINSIGKSTKEQLDAFRAEQLAVDAESSLEG